EGSMNFAGLYHLEGEVDGVTYHADGDFLAGGLAYGSSTDPALDLRVGVWDQIYLAETEHVALVVSPELGVSVGPALSPEWGEQPILGFNSFADGPDLSNPPDRILVSEGDSGEPWYWDADLSWGRWDDGDVLVLNSRLVRSDQTALDSGIEWAVFTPASVSDVASLDGQFFKSVDFMGHGGIDYVSAGFTIDLVNGGITDGYLQVYGDMSVWSFQDFNGSVNGAFVDVTGMTGTWNSDTPATGDLRGAFVGTGAQIDFVGGFVLEAAGAPTTSGLVIMSE